MRVLVDRQAVGALHVRVRPRQVSQDRRRAAEPLTPPATDHGAHHIPPPASFEIQFNRNPSAHHSVAVLGHLELPLLVPQNFLREAPLAATAFAPACLLAVSHGLPFSIFVELVPVVLHATEDELAILLVLRGEASAVLPQPLALLVNFLTLPSPGPGIRAVHARWSRAQMRVLRAMQRPEVVRVKELLQSAQILLVAEIVKMVLSMQMRHERSNAIDHLGGRDAVDVALQSCADVFQRTELIDIRQCYETVTVSGSIACRKLQN